MAEQTDPRPGETEAARADRNFNELLQELRVAQTGVQILFAFLLTLPLQARFDTLDGWDRGVFVAALLLSAGASIFLISPVAYHRLLFRGNKKDWIVRHANRSAEVGLALLAGAITASVALVLDLVLPRPVALAVGAAVAALIVTTWLVTPLTAGRRSGMRS